MLNFITPDKISSSFKEAYPAIAQGRRVLEDLEGLEAKGKIKSEAQRALLRLGRLWHREWGGAQCGTFYLHWKYSAYKSKGNDKAVAVVSDLLQYFAYRNANNDPVIECGMQTWDDAAEYNEIEYKRWRDFYEKMFAPPPKILTDEEKRKQEHERYLAHVQAAKVERLAMMSAAEIQEEEDAQRAVSALLAEMALGLAMNRHSNNCAEPC